GAAAEGKREAFAAPAGGAGDARTARHRLRRYQRQRAHPLRQCHARHAAERPDRHHRPASGRDDPRHRLPPAQRPPVRPGLHPPTPPRAPPTQAARATPPPVPGGTFGFDFDPVAARIRVVSDADQTLALNPDPGAAVGPATNLAFAAGDPNAAANPTVVGSAYDRNFTSPAAATAATTLFAIPSTLHVL